jgi:hypothetical protein
MSVPMSVSKSTGTGWAGATLAASTAKMAASRRRRIIVGLSVCGGASA